MGQIAAFVSGKGGTGKTTLTAAVAGALAKQGKRVLCIDLDVGLRNLDIPLGMRDEASISFQDVIDGRFTLAQAPEHPMVPGLQFLTAPVGLEPHELDEVRFFDLLDEAKEQFDWVMLDAPAGVGWLFRVALRRATRAVVVTQADPACLRDAQRAGLLVKQYGPQWVKVVINRVDPKLYRRLSTDVDDIMDSVGLPLLGLVPEHADVPVAANWGIPLCNVLECRAVDACMNIARRLEGESVPLAVR